MVQARKSRCTMAEQRALVQGLMVQHCQQPIIRSSNKQQEKRDKKYRDEIVHESKEAEKIEGVSRRALKSAKEWLGSRSLTSVNVNQENNQIDSVEMWIYRNVPNVVSIKLNRKESGMSAPAVSS